MKRVLLLASALFTAFLGNAQQDAQFSQNMFINSAINPGAAGIKGMHCFDMLARDQWFGFEGRPQTGVLNYSGPVPRMDNLGMGAVLVYDKLGFENNISFKVNGAYHLNVGQKGGRLGIGLDLGILQRGMSGITKAVNNTDPSVNINGQSDMGFDLGFGLFYYKPKSLYFGISGQKLLPQNITFGSATTKLRQHAYITTGYYHEVNANIVLKPNVLVKTDLTSTQLDVNLTAEFQEKVWLGASYRVQDAFVANVGYNVPISTPANGQRSTNNFLKVGIAYDYTTQALKNKGTSTSWNDDGSAAGNNDNNRSFGAVELYLGYCFIPPTPPDFDTYVDPLFL